MKKSDYNAYLQSTEWQVRRQWALDNAEFRCQVCNSPDKPHVHHRTYARVGKEHPADLTVLCGDCHATFHGKLPPMSERVVEMPAAEAMKLALHKAVDAGQLQEEERLLLHGAEIGYKDGHFRIRLPEDSALHSQTDLLGRMLGFVALELRRPVTWEVVDDV